MTYFNLGMKKSKPLVGNLITSYLILFFLVFSHPLHAQQSSTQADSAEPKAAETDCETTHKQIYSIQKNIFHMKANKGEGKNTYLELLKERDQLNSRKVMIKTLIGLWNQYNGYLVDSADYNTTPENTRRSLKGLTDLRGLIANNSQAVQKYQLMTDVFKEIDPSSINGQTAEENFNLLKTKLQESCVGDKDHLMHCDMASSASKDGINIWDTMQPGTPPPASASGRQAMLHKFIETSSAALGFENFGWWRNLSSMFVDNESLKYDLVAKGNLSQSVVSTLDIVIAECRKQTLLSEGSVSCMEKDLSEIVPTANNYDYVSHIREYLGSDVKNAKDLMDKYLENSQKISTAHEEIAGGTIDKFKALTEERIRINHNLNLADSLMSQDAERARENVTKAAALEVAKLSRSLNALRKNDKLYAIYDSDEEKDQSPDEDSSIGAKANKELVDILRVFSPTTEFDGLFINAGEEGRGNNRNTILGMNPDKLFELFKDANITKAKLEKLLLDDPEMGKGLNSQIADIDRKLAEFKQNPEFNILQRLKNFAWKKAQDKCVGSQRERAKEFNNTKCIADENFSEVDKLLSVGGEILSYQNNLETDLDINALEQSCKQLRSSNPDTFKNYRDMCNEVNDMQKEIAARQEYFSKEQVHQRARVSTGNRDGRKFYSYKKKSWAEIMPGALRLAMPAGMQLGQTWVQTTAVKSQMLGVTTYAKARHRYLENQYNQGVAMCNTTMSCYFNAQYQAFLPSYGNGIGNVGSSAFTTNSTFFAQ